jgi:hypothetical protein
VGGENLRKNYRFSGGERGARFGIHACHGGRVTLLRPLIDAILVVEVGVGLDMLAAYGGGKLFGRSGLSAAGEASESEYATATDVAVVLDVEFGGIHPLGWYSAGEFDEGAALWVDGADYALEKAAAGH